MKNDGDRSERLLALILIHQMKESAQRNKVQVLNLAGFSNVEIADLLQTTSAVVSQSLYEMKAGKAKRKTARTARVTKARTS